MKAWRIVHRKVWVSICECVCAIWYAIYVKCSRRFRNATMPFFVACRRWSRREREIGRRKVLTAQIYYLSRRLTIKANLTECKCELWNARETHSNTNTYLREFAYATYHGAKTTILATSKMWQIVRNWSMLGVSRRYVYVIWQIAARLLCDRNRRRRERGQHGSANFIFSSWFAMHNAYFWNIQKYTLRREEKHPQINHSFQK